jgi:DNA-binding NarL/FixJ family response regulator
MIRLILVDDHEIVRRGLIALLEASGQITVVGDAGDAAGALELAQRVDFDVAVLDIRLPDGSGVDVCRSIRDAKPDAHCLILTSFSDDEAFDAALVAGARGYVLKDIRSNDLISAVQRVAKGESLLSVDAIEHAKTRVQRRMMENRRLESLSDQERRVLELLSEGLSNREIADEMFLAEKTVKNYVSNLLAKLGFHRRTEAALFAQKHLRPNSQT